MNLIESFQTTMRLVFAIKSLNVKGGGAEKVLVEIANGLVHRGHDVFVVSFDSDDNSFYELDGRVIRIALGLGEPGVPTPRIKLIRSLHRIRKAVKRVKPDLAVGFMHSMYIPLGLALCGSSVRVIAGEHTDIAHFKSRPVQRAMVKLLNVLYLGKTVPSDFLLNKYSASERKKMTVLSNPIDIAQFQSASDSKICNSSNVILCVGRFMQEKNHIELIDAFNLIASKHPNWMLRMVGDGVLRPQIESEISARGLSQKIELLGTIKNVASEYHRAAIVAVPSLYESFGMVIVESQAAGRVVIGFSDCPGINEMVKDGVNGVLVSGANNRVQNFADGLEMLIENPELRQRLGAAGIPTAQRFSVNNVLDQWETYFHSLIHSE